MIDVEWYVAHMCLAADRFVHDFSVQLRIITVQAGMYVSVRGLIALQW